jgi:CHAD domain-containing protein
MVMDLEGREFSAVKAAPILLMGGMTAEDSFRLTLLECQAQVAGNVAAMMRARDPRGLHQMRVGFRRMDAAFSAFGEAFKTPTMRGLKDRAKTITKEIGPARDMDVFTQELLEPAAEAHGEARAFAALKRRTAKLREDAWDAAIAAIEHPKFQKLLDDLSHAIEISAWRRESDTTEGFVERIEKVAAKTLDKRMKKARERAKHLKSLGHAECHKLRIALKKMRYAAEFFRPLHDEKQARKFLEQLSRMQDILGALNDVAAARLTLARMIETDPRAGDDISRDLHFAAGIVYGWHLDRATERARKSVKRWKKIDDIEPYWRD